MVQRLIVLLLVLCSMGACRQSTDKSRPESGPNLQVIPTGGEVPMPTPVAPESLDPRGEGRSSGGGGSFSDEYAKQALTMAQKSLSHMLRTASPEIFENFPQDKDQNWLAGLLDKAELRKTDDSWRHGNPLKFNYDLETEKIWATLHYVQTFPYGRLWTREPKEQHRILLEVMLDLLHEASHFYGIGTSEEEDPLSDQWASGLLEALSKDILACATDLDDRLIADSFLYIHRPSGLFLSKRGERSQSSTQLSESFVNFNVSLQEEGYRFLTSPRTFISEFNSIWSPVFGSSIYAVRKLQELSGVEVKTGLEDQIYEGQEFMPLQSPNHHYGTMDADHNSGGQDGESSFGAPEQSDGSLLYRREFSDAPMVWDNTKNVELSPVGTMLFDEFTLDTTTLKAQYSYGVRTAEPVEFTLEQRGSEGFPLYEREFNYTCNSIVKDRILLAPDGEGNFIERVESQTRIPTTHGDTYSEFLITMANLKGETKVSGGIEEIVYSGSSQDQRPCAFELYVTPLDEDGEKTVIIYLEAGEVHSDHFTGFFLQSNFKLEGDQVTAPQNQIDYNLIKAERSSRNSLTLHQGGSGRNRILDRKKSGEDVNLIFEYEYEEEIIIEFNANHWVTRVTAKDHHNGVPDLVCEF